VVALASSTSPHPRHKAFARWTRADVPT
jgi:hypothetical protein